MRKSRFGFFSDFRTLPGNCYSVLLAKTNNSGLYSIAPATFLAASALSSFFNEDAVEEGMFHPVKFLQNLHDLFMNSDIDASFSLAMLCLDPLREELVYISFGKSVLYHLPRESQVVRLVENENSLFSKHPNTTFRATRDRFEEGDLLCLVFDTESPPEQIGKKMLENRYLIAERQAQEILKLIPGDTTSFPLCCTISRIA